jgi:hypothetical protein
MAEDQFSTIPKREEILEELWNRYVFAFVRNDAGSGSVARQAAAIERLSQLRRLCERSSIADLEDWEREQPLAPPLRTISEWNARVVLMLLIEDCAGWLVRHEKTDAPSFPIASGTG